MSGIGVITREIHGCQACPRLRRHCLKMAQVKKRAYRDQTYWGKPISGFGDPNARLVIVGLAPAAHGANRTGRIFTGDRSGDWLYRALHKAGFANQSEATSRTDGLVLTDAYISCVVKCAPPDNRPSPAEIIRCAHYLNREIAALKNAQVFLALGRIALDGLWKQVGQGERRPNFSHGARYSLPDGRPLVLSFHPSQQNTFTGRLTEPMFDSVFTEVKRLL